MFQMLRKKCWMVLFRHVYRTEEGNEVREGGQNSGSDQWIRVYASSGTESGVFGFEKADGSGWIDCS